MEIPHGGAREGARLVAALPAFLMEIHHDIEKCQRFGERAGARKVWFGSVLPQRAANLGAGVGAECVEIGGGKGGQVQGGGKTGLAQMRQAGGLCSNKLYVVDTGEGDGRLREQRAIACAERRVG